MAYNPDRSGKGREQVFDVAFVSNLKIEIILITPAGIPLIPGSVQGLVKRTAPGAERNIFATDVELIFSPIGSDYL